LVNRARECRLIERLLDDARSGQSRVLVVHGEPGIGKTALMEHAIASATGYHVARATGVESEVEVAFAGLLQVCTPVLDQLAALPDPQRDAMSAALGHPSDRPPDRFLIGLALLNLLSNASENAPVLVVVDDAQWLDRASAHALGFAARRLLADRVCVLFGTREFTGDLRGLPDLPVEGLANHDAAALLASVLPVQLDPEVRDRVIAEAFGNPLALLEWPRGLPAPEVAGGFGLPTPAPVAGQIEESFRRRLGELPPRAQQFLTLAAADPTGDAALLWAAAAHLGLGADDATPAIDAGLMAVGTRVRFRHPTVRSAVYGSASASDRREAHASLARATDPHADPDRRAWHLALAAAGPDEEVADQLERSAAAAEARGGVSAVAALLDRSVALTPDASKRAQRAIAAAAAYIEAGVVDAGDRLLAEAESSPLDQSSRAQVEVIRATSAHASGRNDEVADLFLSAAKRLYTIDVCLARDLHVIAMAAASSLTRGMTVIDAAKAARTAPPPLTPERPQDLLLDGLADLTIDGITADSARVLRKALREFHNARTEWDGPIAWLQYQCVAAVLLWDLVTFEAVAENDVQAARKFGALRALPNALNSLALAKLFVGDLPAAASLIGEAASIVEATTSTFPLYAEAPLEALRGRPEAVRVIAMAVEGAGAQGNGKWKREALSARATFYNGMTRYGDALAAAREADRPPSHWGSHVTLHELVEAAVRAGNYEIAAQALERISASAQASGSDWGLGVESRSRALLSEGNVAETLYLEAIERLERTSARPEAARAHLLYGEWFRQQDRRADARRELRAAHEQLSAIGMEAFAARAARELAAIGETVRTRSVVNVTHLTAQEMQIARLVADGRTNQEIGTQLFISARTVEWHLRKVFTKFDVRSRRGVRERMAQSRDPTY
jgi:DNA-binding CsgD family transcriptional regulator